LNGSDFAAATGVSRYKAPHKLWRVKRGIDPEENLDDVPAVQFGVQNEPEARWEFEAYLLGTEYPTYSLTQPGLTVYKLDPRFAVSLDNLAIDAEGDPRFVVEYKCREQHRGPYPEVVPLEYLVQIQVQMEFADVNMGYLYVYRPEGSEFIRINRNKDFFDDFIYPKVKQFVQPNYEPPKRMPNGSRDKLRAEVMSYFPEIYGQNSKKCK
jgi:hypothetical protein